MDVILFGPPGAGKGTQATSTCAHLGVPHVSTGDIFRKHLREGTELGQLARSYMDRGALVPDDVVVQIVASRLEDQDALGGVLFDGFPRTVRQAELLSENLQEMGRKVDVAINLAVPDAVLVARLSGRRTCTNCGATYHVAHSPTTIAGVCDRCGSEVIQRPDDSEETVRARLDTYHQQTAPVLAWLRGRTAVVDVDADQGIEQVREAIRLGLAALDG